MGQPMPADEPSTTPPNTIHGPNGEFLGWYTDPDWKPTPGVVATTRIGRTLPDGSTIWESDSEVEASRFESRSERLRVLQELLDRVRRDEIPEVWDIKPEYFQGMAAGHYVDQGMSPRVVEATQQLRAICLELAEELAKLRDGQARRTPAIPSAFADGQGLISSSLTVQSVFAGLYAGQDDENGWRNGEGNMPAFDFSQSQGTVRLLMRPESDAPPSQAITDALWSQVRQFSDNDGDVLLAMMAQAMGSGQTDQGGSTWITASAILDYRGVQPIKKREGKALYRAGHRTEDIAEVAACVGRLSSQWIELIAVETREPQRGKRQPKVTRTSYESKLFTVDEVIRQGVLEGRQHPVAWRYRLGRCITEFLSAPNRQVARLMQCVLEYDPYRQSFEKRLGRYFTIHHRISVSYKRPLRRKIGGLLNELRLPIDEAKPSRTLRRFGSAMDRLVADDVLPAWRYTPESTARLKALPARGWLADWLACVVEIPAPAMTLDAPAEC